jgi:hypothetical protein
MKSMSTWKTWILFITLGWQMPLAAETIVAFDALSSSSALSVYTEHGVTFTAGDGVNNYFLTAPNPKNGTTAAELDSVFGVISFILWVTRSTFEHLANEGPINLNYFISEVTLFESQMTETMATSPSMSRITACVPGALVSQLRSGYALKTA